MMKAIPSLILVAALGAPLSLWASETGDAMLGGALGGALGAAVGSELGGRDGAILGGALGGATGTAMTTRRHRHSQPKVIYVDRHSRGNRADYGPPRSYGPPRDYYDDHPGRRRGHYKQHDWD